MQTENLVKLKSTILLHLKKIPLSADKHKLLKKGKTEQIQGFLIETAILYGKNVPANTIDRAWLYCEYLSQFDSYSQEKSGGAKATLERMIKNTCAENIRYIPAAYLKHITFSIANEANNIWNTLPLSDRELEISIG